jgi:ribosomal protein L40E
MSSATLTDTDRRARRAAARARAAAPAGAESPDASSLHPWHFFLLATLSLATGAVVFMRHASGPAIAFVALTVCAAGYAGYALYRTLAPLTGEGVTDEAVMVGGRTRAALERDKGLTLRAIKELEFDHAMGKVADADFAEMRDRLRARALRLMRQLEGAEAYRRSIERDLAARVPAASDPPHEPAVQAAPAHGYFCTQCGASAGADARFCRMCGTPLHAPAGARS